MMIMLWMIPHKTVNVAFTKLHFTSCKYREASTVKLLESSLQLITTISEFDEVTNMQRTAKNYLRGHGDLPPTSGEHPKMGAVNRELRAGNSQLHVVSTEPANDKRQGRVTRGKKQPAKSKNQTVSGQ